MKIRHILIFIILATLIVSFYQFINSSRKPETVINESTPKPDYQAKELTFKIYNDQGLLSAVIHTKKIQQFPDQPTQFIQPDIEVIKPSWHITADRGQLLANNTIVLNGNIKLRNIHPKILFTADHAKIFHKEHIGEFEGNIRLELNGSEITADSAKCFMTHHKLSKLILKGEKKQAIYYQKNKFIAKANFITYDPRHKYVDLKGNAIISQNGNDFRAEDIRYLIDKQRIISRKNKTVISISSNIISNQGSVWKY